MVYFPLLRYAPCAVFILMMVRGNCGFATPAAQIYQRKCASCHGQDGGGGTDQYEGPLYGEESVDELAERIAETMPEDNPEDCVGDEARSVAAYIHREFYSKEARLRQGLLAQPRIELVRLTVPQYRNAIADLLAQFTPPPKGSRPSGEDADEQPPPNETGLQAAYHESKDMSKTESLKLSRVDKRIDFDFGDQGPAEGIDPSQFAVIWQGSFTTQDTGEYEFRIRTPNGVRLYVNTDNARRNDKLRDDSSQNVQSRLIDAWVSNHKMRTLSGKVLLLGGRRYPIRLEFFKFKDPTASVRLEWKPPHGTWSVIDESVLNTAPASRTFVVDTPFPADDRSLGYERGSSVSREWHAATAAAALATAEEVVSRLPLLSGVGKKNKRRRLLLGEFVSQFASHAFRRPLSDEEQRLFRVSLFDGNTSEVAVRRAVVLTLLSPHFLYTSLPSTDAASTSYAHAARLALILWDSIPDDTLRLAAKRGELATSAQVRAQAERMVRDPRARAKMQAFLRHWLELEERDLAKDRDLFPVFDEAVIADLRRSLELFVDQVVWSDSSDYRQMLLADYLLLNSRLRKVYGKEETREPSSPEENSTFELVAFESEGRAGILTHPYLLSAFAYHNNTSPIHRGVFLTRNIIGRPLKPPPVAVSFKNNQFAPELTMREKVTELTRDRACQSCHEVINPLGFALENYDAVGRWRDSEKNKPIDTRGNYTSPEGTIHPIANARDIANFAIHSPAAQRVFVTQLFHHLVQQDPAAYGERTVEQLRRDFTEDSFHMVRLMTRIATLAAMHDQAISTNQEISR